LGGGRRYKFDREGVYVSYPVDPECPRQSYLDYIETLPLAAGPAVFGLHENANIMCAQVEAFDTFNTILLMNASSGSGKGGGASREDIIGAAAADAESRLAKFGLFDNEQVGAMGPSRLHGSASPLIT
jgi:dynein heavy chain